MLANAPVAANSPLQTSLFANSLSTRTTFPSGVSDKPYSARLEAVANSRHEKVPCFLEAGLGDLDVVEDPLGEKLLDRPVEGQFTGGCADSGFAAAMGAPTICAVGPVGGKAHSPEEFLEVDTVVPRAQALALAIMRLGAN